MRPPSPPPSGASEDVPLMVSSRFQPPRACTKPWPWGIGYPVKLHWTAGHTSQQQHSCLTCHTLAPGTRRDVRLQWHEIKAAVCAQHRHGVGLTVAARQWSARPRGPSSCMLSVRHAQRNHCHGRRLKCFSTCYWRLSAGQNGLERHIRGRREPTLWTLLIRLRPRGSSRTPHGGVIDRNIHGIDLQM